MTNYLFFCPVCESKIKTNYAGKYRGKSKLFSKHELRQCLECEVIFVFPLPTPAELDQYYKTVWLQDEDIISVSKEMEMIYQIQGDLRCDYLIRHHALSEGSKLLDVGSGHGYLFESIRKKGFENIDFFATDPSPICLQKLRSLGINTFDSLKEISEKNFDIVTLGQVLEHVPDPNTFLKSIVELVKDGGHIYIDVPDRDDTHKVLLEPHTLFYSKKSLLKLAKKLSLKMVHVTSFGVMRNNFIFPQNLIHRFSCKVKSLLRRILNKGSENDHLKKKLFDTYQFDREGDGGWWIRGIFKVG
jgi:SAM-dependent methyltransferase